MDQAIRQHKYFLSEFDGEPDAHESDSEQLDAQHAKHSITTIRDVRKTAMERKTEAWITDHPRCFSERFLFFWSENGYNKENAFMSQALRGGFFIADQWYISAYQYYSAEKAKVVEECDLERKGKISRNCKATGLYRTLLDGIDGLDYAGQMKALMLDFNWTEESVAKWDSRVRRVLYTGNFYKFTRHEHKYKSLLATEDKYLVKACPRECVCTCGVQFHFLEVMEHRHEWKSNLLGKMLMLLRKHLRELYPQDGSRPWSAEPTEGQLAEAENVDHLIDDGRNHQCDSCRDFDTTRLEGTTSSA